MKQSGLVCALSGHRDLPENFDRELLLYDLDELLTEGYDYFLCGMARGFDLTALSCLIELKARYRVRVKACIPFRDQCLRFPRADRVLYEKLLAQCDDMTVLADHYSAGCMPARNRYMVDRCDLVFAYCTKKQGGTAYTVQYAKSKGVEVRLM